MQSRFEWFAWGAFVVVVGCASTRKEEPQPLGMVRTPREADSATAPERTRELAVDPKLPADALGPTLATRARGLGIEAPVAFVWGDISPLPDGARRARLSAGPSKLDGWLVPAAQNVDMGKLAPEIHDVVMVGCEKHHLVGSHPSGPGRHRIDFTNDDAETRREAHELFAFVSVEPGDVNDAATAGDVIALLEKLPTRVRYAVMGLSD